MSTKKNDEASESKWICKICLDKLKRPVVTQCGHLFCWSCLYRWLDQQPSCPVCQGGINRSMITPIYGHDDDDDNDTKGDDNESKEGESSDNAEGKQNEQDIPNRPRGHRQDPPPRRRNMNSQFEIHFFGGLQIIEFLTDLLQGNRVQYASDQDQFDDLMSKGIIVFLVFLIMSILLGWI